MSIQDYELHDLIGKGSYGAVYRAKRKADGIEVVIKQVVGIGQNRAWAEAQVLADLAHPTIVKYYETFEGQSEKTLYLVMEYCDGGDLSGLIQSSGQSSPGFNRRRPGLPESTVLDYLAQMALALNYLHSQNIMHRDLKSPNVFLQDGCRRIKLGDFGVSTFLETSMDFAETCIGTPFYMSPELFVNQPYNFKSDIWALGCITYEILTGNHAFYSESLSALSDRVLKGQYSIPRVGSPNLLQLLKRMLSVNPNKRPTAAHILKSPLLNRPLRCFLDRYLSTACSVEQKNEIDSLVRQIQVLGLEGISCVNPLSLCPSQEMVLYQPETLSSLATNTIKKHADDIFIENLEHAESDVEEIFPIDNISPNNIPPNTIVSSNPMISWKWSSVPPYESVKMCYKELLPGNLSMRRTLLQRKCKEILGDDNYERCFALLESQSSSDRLMSFANREFNYKLEAELGPGWHEVCRLVEQIVWIDINKS